MGDGTFDCKRIGPGKWTLQVLEGSWTEAALVSAIHARWHIDQSIKRNLGTKLDSLKMV
jgi:hypothetical protein